MEEITLTQKQITKEAFYDAVSNESKRTIQLKIQALLEKIIYLSEDEIRFQEAHFPTSQEVILANGKNGGFETGYDLVLIQNALENAIIVKKVMIGPYSTSYLIQKIDENAPSICFMIEDYGGAGEIKVNLIKIIF